MRWINFIETQNRNSLKEVLVMTNQRIRIEARAITLLDYYQAKENTQNNTPIDLPPSTLGLLRGIAFERGYIATMVLYPDLMVDNLYRLADAHEVIVQMDKYPKKFTAQIPETQFSKFQIAVFS